MSDTQKLKDVENFTPEQAIGLLIQGVKIGQSRGKYVLEEAPVLLDAINTFTVKEGEESAPKEKQEGSLNILIQGVQKAQEGGAFTLEDASVLSKAIATFKGPDTGEVKAEEVKEVEESK